MSLGVSSCSSCCYRESPPSISFSGSGFMATYQLGVVHCFLNYVPWMLRTAPLVLGASAGSLVAAAVVCEISCTSLRDEMLLFAKQMKASTLGPFNPSINVFHWLEIVLHKYLPTDAHKMANGRLAVAVTRMVDAKPCILSEFQSRDDVLQALLCSCFVPGYCGMVPPSIKGVYYLDGGFRSMQPMPPVHCKHILMVSPFSGEADICPADKPCISDLVVNGTVLKANMDNCFRIINALYPFTVKSLEEAYDSGYTDGLHFLQSNNLIPYLTCNMPQEPQNDNQTRTCDHLETDMEEEQEEETKVEEEITSLTSFADIGYMQIHGSAEDESTDNGPVQELPHRFDWLKNVLLCNMVAYLSMFGLPGITLSHLLLPLTLLFYIVPQIRHRLELLFRWLHGMGFWIWYSLGHFTLFICNITVGSIKKNLQNQIMPIMLFFKWVKIQSQR